MKNFFKRKKKGAEQIGHASPEVDESGLYARNTDDEPLDEYTDGYGRQIRRTSRHSPARRRESSNRTSDREIFFLFLRLGLILAGVVVAFFALKFVVGRVTTPSEEQQERWEEEAAVMEKAAENVRPAVPQLAVAGAQAIDLDFLESKLEDWAVSERHFRAAEALERRGMFQEATERLLQSLGAAPQNRPAQLLLLDIYSQTENHSAIAALCIRLLDQDSRETEVKKHLLRALEKTDELEAAILLAADLLDEDPGDLVVMEVLAPAQEKMGLISEALASYDRILEKSPENWLALEARGRLNEQAGEWADAIPYYLSLVKIDPLPEYYHALARCYSQQGEDGKAVIFLGQAASLFSGKEVSQWLRMEEFDPIRETVSFRAFADRIVGIEARKAIEAIRQREVARQAEPAGGDVDIPRPQLNAIQRGE